MQLVIDRTLPVSLRSQLHGLIEYGISCGDLAPGEALPSVRELAETLGVAPMTVAQVYADLKTAGLVETRPGAGTFVSHGRLERTSSTGELSILYGQIDSLIDQSRKLGMRSGDLIALIGGRVSRNTVRDDRRRILMVGLFGDATESYARFIGDRLGPEVIVEPVTVSALESDPAIRARAGMADLVVTFVNKQQQVETLLPDARVVAIRFTPSEETRRSLASLDSLARIAAVSRFPEFLPILKSGVTRFAPHIADVAADTIDSPGLTAMLSKATVLVFATGAEDILAEVAPDMPRVEYRHAPDTADIERVIVPALSMMGRVPRPDAENQPHSNFLQKDAR